MDQHKALLIFEDQKTTNGALNDAILNQKIQAKEVLIVVFDYQDAETNPIILNNTDDNFVKVTTLEEKLLLIGFFAGQKRKITIFTDDGSQYAAHLKILGQTALSQVHFYETKDAEGFDYNQVCSEPQDSEPAC